MALISLEIIAPTMICCADAPGQAALITDILRSALYLRQSWRGAPLGELTLAGHSLGGGSSLVASSYLDRVNRPRGLKLFL